MHHWTLIPEFFIITFMAFSSNQLHDHYSKLLGILSPWRVADVQLNLELKWVEIFIQWTPGEMPPCPDCGKPCSIHDHAAQRTWRHLDTMQFETRITCRLPRIHCHEHGVKTVQPPWAEPGSRFTRLFEQFAIDVLLASRSVVQAVELLGLCWESAHRIMERAVQRGLSQRDLEKLRYLGLDEKSFRKGQSYVSLMTDLEESRVIEVVEGRDRSSADLLWESLSQTQRQQVEAVAMDMAREFRESTREHAPQAKIVHDKFHISQHINQAVGDVFRQENNALQEQGDQTLKGTRYVWLKNPGQLPDEMLATLEKLRMKTLKVSRAWAIKEFFLQFWTYTKETSARTFFKKWFGWASRSRLRPIIKVARMLKNHMENILTYFTHPITNAVSEGLNSKIQSLKSNARGFRNFENYRIRILFFCGKLNLYPQ
jgi:transposase